MSQSFRLVRMAISGWDINIMHRKNPWMTMWWSAALPGLGHLCQGVFLKGLLLMGWEILVNIKAGINLAILYTFNGEFEQASKVLDSEWALFYGVILFFSMYDSYRISTETNLLVRLEMVQPEKYFTTMKLTTGGLQFLGRSNPWAAVAWSALLTGFGHLYNGRGFKSLILLGWAVTIIWMARINDSIIHTFMGEFERVGESVKYEWLLFFPSIYIFAIWDSYSDAVEMNKLFADAQKNHFRKIYGWMDGEAVEE